VFLVFRSHTGGMAGTMLRTGDVARRLSVSRQHVVDMCDRGDIRFVAVGTHRRIPMSEVDRLVHGPRELTREQSKSLWLHRAVLGRLMLDPNGVIGQARDRLDRWSAVHRPDGKTIGYFNAWREVLDSGIDRVVEALTSTDELSCELRQNTPFTGVLSQDERLQVLRNFNDYWTRQHETVR